MDSLRLKFGSAKHGWLPLTLELENKKLEFCLSYMPNDFLLELTEALVGTLQNEGTHVATLPEEPAESEWIFYRVQDQLVFSIVQHSDHRRIRNKSAKLLECWGTPIEVVVPLWRGLRELDSRKLKEGFKQSWSFDFPSDALNRLTSQIRSNESAT